MGIEYNGEPWIRVGATGIDMPGNTMPYQTALQTHSDIAAGINAAVARYNEECANPTYARAYSLSGINGILGMPDKTVVYVQGVHITRLRAQRNKHTRDSWAGRGKVYRWEVCS